MPPVRRSRRTSPTAAPSQQSMETIPPSMDQIKAFVREEVASQISALETIPPSWMDQIKAFVREEVASQISALTRTAIPSGNTHNERASTAAVLTPVTSNPTGDETPEEGTDMVYNYVTSFLRFEMCCIFGFLEYMDALLSLAVWFPWRIVSPLLKCRFDRQQFCDILNFLLFCLLLFVMKFEFMIWVHHTMAGWNPLVIYPILVLADRKLSDIGQDLLDSLYRTVTDVQRRNFVRKWCLYFILAWLRIALQKFLIICQLVVLIMIFEDNAMLSIMISITSTEIEEILKWKKKDMNHLLHTSLSDVRERFHLAVLLSVASITNLKIKTIENRLQITLYIMFIRIMVHLVKHVFMTMFCGIHVETYRTFTVNLAQNISTFTQNNAHANYLDLVYRKLGLAPIPLLCCLMTIFIQFLTNNFAYHSIILFGCFILAKLLLIPFILRPCCEYLLQLTAGARSPDRPV